MYIYLPRALAAAARSAASRSHSWSAAYTI